MDNITIRKQRRRHSDCDILNDTIFNSTLLEISTQSETSAPIADNSIIIDLEKQLTNTNSELVAAHIEIDNLNLEINKLKQSLEVKEKTIGLLKKISTPNTLCPTPARAQTRTPLRRKLITSQIKTPRISPLHSAGITSREIYERFKNKPQGKKSRSSAPLNYDEVNHTCSKIDLAEIIVTSKTVIPVPKGENIKRNIIILADQQGRYLRNILQNLVGPKYKVTCYLKPGAKLTDVLNGHDQEIKSLTKNDYIVLLAGINDNAYSSTNNLKTWLEKVGITNVIISEIPYNNYLNVHQLNDVFKNVCRNFSNSVYIDMDYSRELSFTKKNCVKLSRNILKEICHIEYKIKFEEYSRQLNIKKSYNDQCTQTDETICDNNNRILAKDVNVNNQDNDCSIKKSAIDNNLFRV
ncbi:hypothetical protein PYW08_008298 [Mythimna loreyi]|uniref:Uncharacterized protein n=1 Tax=Mythimna loreyi TaxID=667449 RepID=A0ACC2QBK4_9NEOP|nr:hypothetical protein PYW08_008298 [Mythimna loreyi]